MEESRGIPLGAFIDGPSVCEPRPSPNGKYVAYKRDGALIIHSLSDLSQVSIPLTDPETHPVNTGTEYGGGTYCWSESSLFIFFTSNGRLFPFLQISPKNLHRLLIFWYHHRNQTRKSMLHFADRVTLFTVLNLPPNYLFDIFLLPKHLLRILLLLLLHLLLFPPFYPHLPTSLFTIPSSVKIMHNAWSHFMLGLLQT